MSPKTLAARRALFLRALRESGNVTLSAERARLARSWVHNQRKRDPGFDGACRAAIAAARAAFAALGSRRPPTGWGYLDGEELVVKAASGGRVQVTRARPDQWTPSAEARFLSMLAATCNVKAACGAAGLSTTSAYNHRKRWPAFARRWDEAVSLATARLALALVRYCINPFSAIDPPSPAGIAIHGGRARDLPWPVGMAAMSVDEALQNLYMHQHASGVGGKPGRIARPMPIADAVRAIGGKIDAINRGARLSEAQKDEAERDFAARRHDPWEGEAA